MAKNCAYCAYLLTFAKPARIPTSRLHRLLGFSLLTVPGLYSMLEVLTSLSVLGQDSIPARAGRKEQESQRCMACTAFTLYDIDTANIGCGVSCKGCQIRVQTPHSDIEDCERMFSTAGFSTHFTYCVEVQHRWTETQN